MAVVRVRVWKPTAMWAVLVGALVAGLLASSVSAQQVPPGEPTGIQATSVAHDSVLLVWDDPSDDTITHYQVLRRDRDVDAPGVFAVVVDSTGSSDVSYADTRVQPEKRYVYRVVAVSAAGASHWSRYVNVETPAAPEVPVEPEEPAEPESSDAAWSATLTVGINDSVSPPALGFSLPLDGTLSVDTFTLDGTEHRVKLLLAAAGGFYLGLSEALQTDFTLRVGDRLFESAESSSVTIPIAADTYWWGDSDLGWSAGDSVEVSLEPVGDTSTIRSARPLAPLAAYFNFVPEHHNGVDVFTFRVYFTNGVPSISYRTVRDHALEVEGGTVQNASRVIRGSNRIWTITVVPDGDGQVSIVLVGGRACDSEGAVCASDGRRLHNGPHVVVPRLEPPPAPGNLRAEPQLDGSVILSWDAPEDDSVTGYQIMRRHPGESDGTMVETMLDTGSTETTYTDDGLTPNVSHAYYVKAVNAAGLSERSNYDNATPFAGLTWEYWLRGPVLLTFDDGPSPPYTNQILDLLSEYGVRATFFVTGTNAALHPELIARIAAEGHAVANHTWQHENLISLTRDEFDSTVSRTQNHLGEHAASCLRPPGGVRSWATDRWAKSLGLRVVLWNVNSSDWKGRSVDELVSDLSEQVTYFSTVLMHDHGANTAEALRILLERWARQGFEFEPVCEPPRTSVKAPNTAAIGSLAVNGLAQVGETLTSDTSGVTDSDGLEGVSFSYQWLADNQDIAEATNSSYRVASEHEGKSITVRVSFIDEAANQESLTSVPTAPIAEAEAVSGSPEAPRGLTVTATDTEGELVVSWEPPRSDNGSEVTGYKVEWKLSADYWVGSGVTEAQTTGTSYTITGLAQASQYAVRVRALNQAGASAASGDALAVPFGIAPLLAEFQDLPASHAGDPFILRISFSEAIANGYIWVRDRAIDVTGGMVLTASQVDGRADLWEIQILPSGNGHVTVVLPAAEYCFLENICTWDGKRLANRLQWTIPGP